MFLTLLSATILLVIYFIYISFFKTCLQYQKLGIPYVSPWKAIHNTLSVFTSSKPVIDIVKEVYNGFPDARYFGGVNFGKPSIYLRDIDLIKKITVKDFEHFADHSNFLAINPDEIFNKNLFSMKGAAWREMRATLSPAFTSAKMRNMFGFMNTCAQNFVNSFVKKNEDVIEVEMKDIVTKYTSDVIASVSFGVECNSVANPENEFYTMGTQLTNPSRNIFPKIILFAVAPALAKMFKMTVFPTQVTDFFRQIVQETIKIRQEKNIFRPDMIHLLLEARKGALVHENTNTSDGDTGFATVQESELGKQKKFMTTKLSDDDIAAQALAFFFGGFDTTASTICFMSYELAKNPDVQGKLQQEIDVVLETSNGKVTFEVLTRMKYLDQVISESLRKWTPGLQNDRLCIKDYVIEPERPNEKPYLIKKGDVVIVPTIGLHYDPQYFPNPEQFDPDRFSDENKKNIVPGSYIPFGNGPRNCIGSRFALLEVKTLFFHLLSKFDLVFTEKTILPMKLKTVGFSMKPDGGFQIGLKRRKCLGHQ
nr:cytochrome P450 monooxygenase CYP9EK1 [Lasioderma serricorne]